MAWQWIRLTNEELLVFARGFVDGTIFTNFHIPPEDVELLPQVFLPLAFDGLDSFSDEDQDNLGVVWAHLDQATHIEVEGYPVFAEIQVMHRLDWLLVAPLIHKLQES